MPRLNKPVAYTHTWGAVLCAAAVLLVTTGAASSESEFWSVVAIPPDGGLNDTIAMPMDKLASLVCPRPAQPNPLSAGIITQDSSGVQRTATINSDDGNIALSVDSTGAIHTSLSVRPVVTEGVYFDTGRHERIAPGDLGAQIALQSFSSPDWITSLVSSASAVLIPLTSSSTSSSTGALQVSGGAGIGGALNVGGNGNIAGSVSTGALSASSLTVSGNANIAGSVSTGALSAPSLTVSGSTTMSNLAVTGTLTYGTLQYSGIAGSQVNATGAIPSTSPDNGALLVTNGGAGVKGDINAGGAIKGASLSTTGSLSVTGAASITGLLTASSGIYFGSGATLSGYSGVGTWTPTLSFGGSSAGITYTNHPGSYLKFGNLLIATFAIGLSNKGTATGAAKIEGLPYTLSYTTQPIGALTAFGNMNLAASSWTQMVIAPNVGATNANINVCGGSNGYVNLGDDKFFNSSAIWGTIIAFV